MVSCNNSRSEPVAGTPTSSATGVAANHCAAQQSSAHADASALPNRIADYCSDPHADTRSYGVGAPLPLRDACADLFGERCGEHLSYGLERIVKQRYLAAHEASSSVQVSLLRFAENEGALGSFAELTVGEGEPTGTGLTAFAAGAMAALGGDVAFVVQGQYVATLRYRNERHTAERGKSDAQRALPIFARALCAQLPQGAKLPEALLGLPEAERVPLGARYVVRDVLGIDGAGPGAIGYYQRDSKRWRVLSIHYADADSAKDAALTLRKTAGWMPHKDTPYDSFKLTFPVPDTGLSVEWVITQQLNRVWGVGDEVEALDPTLSDTALAQRRLSYLEKLELLGKLLRVAH